MLKPIIVFIAVTLMCILIIPAIIVQFIPQTVGQVQEEITGLQEMEGSSEAPVIYISVYRTAQDKIEKVPLENYIRGVVAAEMPSEFELEALKAQALAARTYIIRRLIEKDYSDVPEGAVVSDSVTHQVFMNDDELRLRWGIHYQRNMDRINQAIKETMGQVLTYQGKPINATYFSTSNGHTENSEEYWNAKIPYLRSVESPWDQASPKYEAEITLSVQEFQQKLGTQLALPVSSSNQPLVTILSRTAGNRVKEVKIGDQTFSGKVLREKLDIPSSHFDIKLQGKEIVIRTKGWGHGVGMSQWGANGMAKEGYQAEDIVKYYYQGIEIQNYRQWIVKN